MVRKRGDGPAPDSDPNWLIIWAPPIWMCRVVVLVAGFAAGGDIGWVIMRLVVIDHVSGVTVEAEHAGPFGCGRTRLRCILMQRTALMASG
jgi:hypothetical protein